jgi:hypothetical protein
VRRTFELTLGGASNEEGDRGTNFSLILRSVFFR